MIEDEEDEVEEVTEAPPDVVGVLLWLEEWLEVWLELRVGDGDPFVAPRARTSARSYVRKRGKWGVKATPEEEGEEGAAALEEGLVPFGVEEEERSGVPRGERGDP